MTEQHPFKWRHFQADIILLCVRWYVRYSLSYRDLEEIMLERGLHVDHTTIYRWVQSYAPELEKRCRLHLKATTDSWRVDETSIKIKKVWMYLYRAVDSEGNTLEFLLSPTRDTQAAKRFFLKALHAPACSVPQARPVEEQGIQPSAAAHLSQSAPRVINVDKNAAYPKAIAELKAMGVLPESVELRQVKYLNNLVEQDHRFIKRRTKPGMGFFSFETAWRTLQGYEVMNMIRKGQVQGEMWEGRSHSSPGCLERLPKKGLRDPPTLKMFSLYFLQHNQKQKEISMPRRIDHVAIIVRNIEQALIFYRDTLGIEPSEIKEVPTEQVRIAFLPMGGPAGSEIELIEPLQANLSLAKFLENRGEGLHHICLEVDDIDAALQEMQEKGAPVLDKQPRVAAEGRAIFLHPKGTHGVLLELIEKQSSHADI